MNRGKLVFGYGLNDFSEPIVVSGNLIAEYRTWCGMLKRCYSKKYCNINPTYKGCEVEPFLLSFTNFYNFIRGLKGFGEVDEKGRAFQMDKDLLVKGNKTYGVDTICFIPSEINLFLINTKKKRGMYPVGVYLDVKHMKYASYIRIFGKKKHLGCYDTPEGAFKAYKAAKEDQAKVLAEKWKHKIDPRVYDALMNFKVSIDD